MLARLPEEVIKELDHMMERLSKGDVEERQYITSRLIDFEKSGKIPLDALLEMADEDNATISMYAVTALGRSKQPAAVQKLIAFAEDYRTRHPMFTETVVDALGEAGDKAATPLLMNFLGVKLGWKSRLMGTFSLTTKEPADGKNALRKYIVQPAARALAVLGELVGRIGKSSGAKPKRREEPSAKKEEASEEEQGFRKYIALPAVRALAKLADPRAAEAFVACLVHEEPLVRWHAIQGIVACGLTDYIETLHRLSDKDPNDLVRESARIAVESMRSPPPPLVN